MSVMTQFFAFATITGSPAGCVQGRITYCLSSASSCAAFGVFSPIGRSFVYATWRKCSRVSIPDPHVIGGDATPIDLEDAVAADPIDLVVVIGPGCDAPHGNMHALGAGERLDDIDMLVAMNDQLGPTFGDRVSEPEVIAEPADLALRARPRRRVMDRDDAHLVLQAWV